MHGYKRILVAVDLSDQSRKVVGRALSASGDPEALMKLLHVVEYVPVEPMGEALLPAVSVEEDLVAGARKRLAALAADCGLPDADAEVLAGPIKSEICREASDWKADLIVIGSRGRHGLGALVNLTEDAVLHGAPCDVLAVRLQDPA
jgi:universal stress protein A